MDSPRSSSELPHYDHRSSSLESSPMSTDSTGHKVSSSDSSSNSSGKSKLGRIGRAVQRTFNRKSNKPSPETVSTYGEPVQYEASRPAPGNQSFASIQPNLTVMKLTTKERLSHGESESEMARADVYLSRELEDSHMVTDSSPPSPRGAEEKLALKANVVALSSKMEEMISKSALSKSTFAEWQGIAYSLNWFFESHQIEDECAALKGSLQSFENLHGLKWLFSKLSERDEISQAELKELDAMLFQCVKSLSHYFDACIQQLNQSRGDHSGVGKEFIEEELEVFRQSKGLNQALLEAFHDI